MESMHEHHSVGLQMQIKLLKLWNYFLCNTMLIREKVTSCALQAAQKKSANLRMLNPLMLFIIFLEKGLTDIKTDVLFCFSVTDNSFRHLLVQRNIDVYNCCRDCHNEEH